MLICHSRAHRGPSPAVPAVRNFLHDRCILAATPRYPLDAPRRPTLDGEGGAPTTSPTMPLRQFPSTVPSVPGLRWHHDRACREVVTEPFTATTWRVNTRLAFRPGPIRAVGRGAKLLHRIRMEYRERRTASCRASRPTLGGRSGAPFGATTWRLGASHDVPDLASGRMSCDPPERGYSDDLRWSGGPLHAAMGSRFGGWARSRSA